MNPTPRPTLPTSSASSAPAAAGGEAAAGRAAPPPARPLAAALALRSKALDVLRSVLGPEIARPYALLDFPCGENLGDSAIWLGTRALLDDLGMPPPSYTCDDRTFEPDVLAKRVGDGPILLLGGGNFGDLFHKHQRLREQVVEAFPRNRVVQLPQSLHFTTPEALAHARSAFSGHRRLTVLVRDAHGLETATRDLGLDAALCPDLAFGLGALPTGRSPRRRILWIRRLDAWGRGKIPESPDVYVTDWPVARTSIRRLRVRWLSSWLRRGTSRGLPLRDWLSRGYDALARERLDRARACVGSGAVVVTNRLHGHVLAMLADRPVVILDDAIGKVRAFFDAWLANTPGVAWANTPAEALALAHEALARTARSDGDRP